MTHYNVETWQSVGLYSTDQIIICNSSTLKLTDGQTNKNGAEMVGWLLICSHLSISDNQLWALSAEIWKKIWVLWLTAIPIRDGNDNLGF